MKKFETLNNILGWLIFLIASTVFLLTIEPTTSWWDCGEYIATSYKLQIGHPPGTPTFQLIGRIFSLFAFGNVENVAKTINALSALCSGFAVLFLFWTITAMARKLFEKAGEMTMIEKYVVLSAGAVGALAFTFSDSFWFSAVEGEVYAAAACATSIAFWAIFKWDRVADERHSNRWLILIAFMIGVSIGIHLLNLLTLPAIVYVYYFRKYKFSKKGFIWASVLSLVITGFVFGGVIPWIVILAGKFELFFINSVGLPFDTGTIIYFVFLIAAIIAGLYLSKKYGKSIVHVSLLCLTFVIIGYSSFFVLIIRSNAGTPINENAPKDALSFLNFLNREQYGDWPLLYGQYYTANVVNTKEGDYNYIKGDKKYIPTSRKLKYEYDPANSGVFTRMWSDQPRHIAAYKAWGGIKSDRMPTFGENMSYFFGYQINTMYLRYFMWNFAGRQNDVQGYGIDDAANKDVAKGNWISGIPFIDKMRLGNQDKIQPHMLNNKARNTFYLLPLILGLIGLFVHFKKDPRYAFVNFVFFFMTGLAIVLYLNQTPYQPRERDYAFAGSFYAFAVWIGFGVIGLFQLLSKKLPQSASIAIVTLASLILVPGIMAKEGWNDHDRSGKYACRDFAKNYLASCAPNAILITNGDNDTFPLWYAQEVEGFRTDVRVVNFTLASGDWYIHQLYKKMYKSEPLPFTLPSEKYTAGTNDFVPFFDTKFKGSLDIKDLMKLINSESEETKVTLPQNGSRVSFLPTKDLKVKVDSLKVLRNGTVPASMANMIPKYIEWKVKKNSLYKNDLMLLDFLATNNWERPIYFASPSSVTDFMDIEDYCYLEGVVFRFIPVKIDNKTNAGILSDRTYDCLMNKFAYGNLNDPKVYADKESVGMAMFLRNNFARLAQSLLIEGKKDKAIKVLDKGTEVFPDFNIPYDMYMISYAELYYMAGADKKATEIVNKVLTMYSDDIDYILSLEPEYQKAQEDDLQKAAAVLQELERITKKYNQTTLSKTIGMKMQALIQSYSPQQQ
jgi:hypothetical protein